MFCYYTLTISTEPISFFTGVSRTFFTAEGRFLSVVSSEVMLVMTVVVTVAARRKTCFPTADAVIATKAEPSEDAIGFLCLTPFYHIPSMYIVKVIAWYDTDFAKCNTIISWHAITISHHEIRFSMCSGNIIWGRGHLEPTSAITTIIPLLANAGGKGVDVVGNGRGGALRLCYKPTRKRWFGGLRFLTVPLMNKK